MTREFTLPRLLDRTVGREDEISRLCELLLKGERRLVTLTGPGGVGKTRLAIHVASRLQNDFEQGVRFLSLAPVRDGTRLRGVILSAVDAQNGPDESAIDRVALALSGQSLLLVLDNMEQLLDESPFVHRVISSCASITVLATSRAPLRIAGEYVHTVRPLDLVAKGDATLSDAVILFQERSLPVSDRGDEGDLDEDTNAVAEICRRLDGLPLAIELAAARTRHLRPLELLARLDHSLEVLKHGPRSAPARLQSLEAAVSWSYDLLSPDEQRFLRRLSVFQGGFTLEAAEAMAEGLSTPFLDLIGALVDHSLIQREANVNGSRYRMLEPIRRFVTDQCVKSEEMTIVRDKHCEWFASRLETPTSSEHMFSQRQITTWRLPDDHENLRIALEWALARKQPILAAQLAEGLATYWFRGAHAREAIYHLTTILDQCDSCPPELQALLHRRIGGAYWVARDDRRAIASAETALALCQEQGNLAGIAACTSLLGQISRPVDPDRSVALFSDALAISAELGEVAEAEGYFGFNMSQRALSLVHAGNLSSARQDVTNVLERIDRTTDPFYFSFSLALLTLIELLEQNYDEAQTALDLFRQSDIWVRDRELVLVEHRLVGELAFARGDARRALNEFQRAFELATSFDEWTLGGILSQIAKSAAALGDLDRAARLEGAAESKLEASGVPEVTTMVFADLHGRTAMREAISSNSRLALAYNEGMNLTDVATRALAMDVSTMPPISTGGRLTTRQIEVLELVALGCTNREIGERLYISKRTVDRHVAILLETLGVSSRRDAVSEARKRQLIAPSPYPS